MVVVDPSGAKVSLFEEKNTNKSRDTVYKRSFPTVNTILGNLRRTTRTIVFSKEANYFNFPDCLGF